MTIGDVEVPTPHRRRRRRTALLSLVLGIAVVAVLLRVLLVGEWPTVTTQSMESGLLRGDRVVLRKAEVARGDVVLFRDPGGWQAETLTPKDNTTTARNYLVGRVVGLPGDRVSCCDTGGQITVNGYPLEESSYLYVGSDGVQVAPSHIRFEVVVPRDRLFVLGDRRDVSADSRCHLADTATSGHPRGTTAFVPETLVIGTVTAVTAPIARLHWLTRPATFVGVPPAQQPVPTDASIRPAEVTC